MKKKTAAAVALCLAALMTVPGAYAYLTAQGTAMMNPFTIALDCTSTLVEKYPAPEDEPNAPVPVGNVISYEKAVQVGNTGFIDEYVRVSLDFSEEAIRDMTKFSWDGVNYWSWAEYRNHLPSGWTYNSADGFFYYTPIVESTWDEIKGKLTYDKLWGEYFYPSSQAIITHPSITTPLIRYVKTEFASPKDMRTYMLNVYNESVPFYFGSDYKQSWENYLAN